MLLGLRSIEFLFWPILQVLLLVPIERLDIGFQESVGIRNSAKLKVDSCTCSSEDVLLKLTNLYNPSDFIRTVSK